MSIIKKKYFEGKRVQRKRSDESINSNYVKRGEDLYQVSYSFYISNKLFSEKN